MSSNRNSNFTHNNLSFLPTTQIHLKFFSHFTFSTQIKSKASLPCSSPSYTHRFFHLFCLLRFCYVFTIFGTPCCSFFNRTFHLTCICFNQKLTQEISGIFRRIRIMKVIIQFSLFQVESPPPSCLSFSPIL